MKRFILSLFILLNFFLFFSVNFIRAQTPTSGPLRISVPGINCGLAGDPQKSQCCVVKYPSLFIPPDLGPLNSLVNTFKFVTDAVNGALIQPIFLIIEDLSKKDIKSCYTGVPSTADVNDISCQCINPITPSPSYLSALESLCQRQSSPSERSSCINCANEGGVWSGAGCIYTDTKSLIEKTIFGWGIGLAGGFALLCIILAAFQMQSSQGNPEKLKKAQEMLTSCIMGLMLIIFSIFILRLIGVNILRIPGFS